VIILVAAQIKKYDDHLYSKYDPTLKLTTLAVPACLTPVAGGRTCRKENPADQKDQSPIKGLHSNWVGDTVLAMARPWQENMVKYDMVQQFVNTNIGMILNLQVSMIVIFYGRFRPNTPILPPNRPQIINCVNTTGCLTSCSEFGRS
jgi:hypothetical protein